MHNLLKGEAESFFKAIKDETVVSIRQNPFKNQSPPLVTEQIPWTKHGYYLSQRPVFTLDPLFHAGSYYVQEASSMLLEQIVKQTVDLNQPLLALDLCAAPGGKSTHLLSLLNKDSLLVSNEVIRHRSNILSENIQKWGYPNAVVTNNDPVYFQNLNLQFDLIVVDAPCSGEGLFRKDEDAIKEWSPENVSLCSQRQQRILSDIWQTLKPGGVLIYSTCTYNSLENEENLKWLNEEISAEAIYTSLPETWGFNITETNGLQGYHAFPHRVKGEGFFIAALRKAEGDQKNLKKQKKPLNLASKNEKALVSEYLLSPNEFSFIKHHETIIAIPQLWQREIQEINDKLSIVYEGLNIASFKKGKPVFEPSLALSTQVNTKAFDIYTCDNKNALHYLRKDAFDFEGMKEGNNLISFGNQPLGWAKRIGHRVNNNYPSHWRIRMEV